MMRNRTREELAALCFCILDCDVRDENSIANSADKLAALLFELSGKTGAVPDDAPEKVQAFIMKNELRLTNKILNPPTLTMSDTLLTEQEFIKLCNESGIDFNAVFDALTEK